MKSRGAKSPDRDEMGIDNKIRNQGVNLQDLYVEIKLDTVEELLEALCPARSPLLQSGAYTPEFLFRGHGDAKWKLIPAARRSQNKSAGHPSSEELKRRDEFLEVTHFATLAEQSGMHIFGDTPELRSVEGDESVLSSPFPPTRYLGLFTLAQHHGIPTRLLDWTRTPISAAYFAAAHATDFTHKIAEMIDQPENHTPSYYPKRLAVFVLHVARAKEHLKQKLRFVTGSAATNSRLRHQNGEFLLWEDELDLEALVNSPLEAFNRESSGPGFILAKLTIPAELAGRLLWCAKVHGVSRATVFSDGDGAAAEITRELTLREGPER